jgi:hypothetical protein
MSVLQVQKNYDLQEQLQENVCSSFFLILHFLLLYPIILLMYMFVDSFLKFCGLTTRSAVGSSLGQAWHAKMLRGWV